MFTSNENEKNIKAYTTLLQDIREGKESIDEATSMPPSIHLQKAKNSVHAQALAHHQAISNITGRYDGHEDETRDGSHLHKTTSELEQLVDNHKKLSDIHRAHATFHSIAGNHEAAENHDIVASQHRNAAYVSNHTKMQHTHLENRESHEEFSQFSDHINADSEDALKEHPLTNKMLSKVSLAMK